MISEYCNMRTAPGVFISRSALAIILSFTLNFTPYVQAETDKGLSIAREMKARTKGFVNYKVDMEMVLVSASGKKKIRKLRVITREVDGDGDQSLAIFESPADIKGTGFLSHTHIQKNDMQWLYLPALKRVKRIAPNNTVAPFMGSEFSYEDLSSYEVESYTYEYIDDENIDGVEYYILKRFPVNEYSGYSLQKIWIEKKRYLPVKTEFYNKKNEKIKTLRSGDYKLYQNRFWFASTMRMENHLSGKSSILNWRNYEFMQPLRAADFKPNSLKRIY